MLGPCQAPCSRCHSVTYCGPECQRKGWKQHRSSCKKQSSTPFGSKGPEPETAGVIQSSRSAVAPQGDSSKPPFPQRESAKPPLLQRDAKPLVPQSSKASAAQTDCAKPSLTEVDSAKPPLLQRDSAKPSVPQRDSGKLSAVQKDSAKPVLPQGDSAKPSLPSARITSVSGTPGDPAPFDVVLSDSKSLRNAQLVIDKLKERGVCVLRAGAHKTLLQALRIESKILWDGGEFREAKKGQPVTPGSEQVKYDTRDDKVVWMTSEWTAKNERKCKALKALDCQLGDFGWGLNQLLEEQLGVTLKNRTPGMLACYAGDAVPGARYDYHVDNPYQTQMEVPDDKRRLTLVYYINEDNWDVRSDGGALQVCLTDPRRAPWTTAEANRHPKLTISPASDTLVCFWAHTMYHAVLPVASQRRRYALSTWFMVA
mmetsp:Transcript_45746/g.105673  ORF Transcript_45746/g.105673 Transcript_45746/m.105673 type:complete len:426 (+) Transcript_45746:45-1322(+)